MSDLLGLRKFVSPEIIFGNDSRLLTGQYARQFGVRKILIVTDPGIIKSGWLVDIQKSIEDVGLPYVVFSSLSLNPRSSEVEQGADVFRNEGCNVIVTVGGGSCMDCAKAIGIVVSNKDCILKFEGIDQIKNPIPPLICIPTTAGSSADVSLIDPFTTKTMNNYLTACTGIDAMVHAIEAYVSTGTGPLTDNYAEEAISLIYNYLPKLLKDPQNIVYREKIMLASLKAGLAFSNAILGAVHAMAHSLGGYLDLAHGECNALLLEHVINFNFDSIRDKYTRIAEIIGIDTIGLSGNGIKNRLMTTIIGLKKDVGITGSLEERGVKLTDIPRLSKKAIKDACMVTNPKTVILDDIKAIYREAL